jgi:hypothetical protein
MNMKQQILIILFCTLACIALMGFMNQPVRPTNNVSETLAALEPGDTSKTIITKNNASTYFACTDTSNTITKAKFLSLIDKPLCVKDKDNKQYPLKGFQILYAEKGLYLDSNDAPIIFTDYSEESFKGDSITTVWKDLLKSRLYKGDTISFENVTYIKDGKNYRGKKLQMAVVE